MVQNGSYTLSNYDAIVGCLVVFEGMIWPFQSCVKASQTFLKGSAPFKRNLGTLLVHEQTVSTKCDQCTILIANQREVIFGGQDVPTVYMYMT